VLIVELELLLTQIDAITAPNRGRSLSEVEIALITGAWENASYQDIADRSGYSINYLQRDIGPRLWKFLSQTFAHKINKTNLRIVLPSLLADRADQVELPPGASLAAIATGDAPAIARNSTIDWGEAIDVSIFYGRTSELATLTDWLNHDQCRVIALLGMGGIGKSALAAKLAQDVQSQFDFVIWRSLRNAPPLASLLCEIVGFLSNQQIVQANLRQLLECLRSARCLVVLDNLETILEGVQAGQFRAGYEDYGELLRVCAESPHRSCMLLTSREKPAEIAMFEGDSLAVRSVRLTGDPAAALALLQQKQLAASIAAQRLLCDRYGNSPLALKIVAASIRDLFGGNVADFLAQDTMVFNGVRRLLEQQFQRLSETEQTLMHWLALNRDLTTIQELRDDIVPTLTSSVIFTALEALLQRSLIEQTGSQFTQQSVVMEYVIEQLIETLSQEISDQNINLFNRYVLVKAQSKNYLRETQKRLVLTPLLVALQAKLGADDAIAAQLLDLLKLQQQRSPLEPGYAASNILSLLEALGCDLSATDFANLAVWQACLANVNLHRVDFSNSDLSRSTFAQAFGSVLSVTFNPQGDRFATVDDHGEIQVWNLADQQSLLALSGHTNWVWTIAFSPDGQYLASGSHDQTIRLWHIENRQCVGILRGHTNWVWSVNFSPDGQYLVSGSWDTTVRLWDLQSGECIRTLTGHTGWVRSVCFSPDGTVIASASQDQTVRLWDRQTGECLPVLSGHEGQVWSVAFSPDGRRLASSGDDRTVRLWDRQTGNCLQVLQQHHAAIRMVAFSADGKWLASGSEDHCICLWDGQTGQHRRTLAEHMSQIWALSFHPNSQLLISGSGDQTVRFWDVESGQCLRVIQGHASQIWSIAFAPATTTTGQLVSAHGDHQVRLWDIQSGKCIRTLQGHRNWVWSVAFSANGKLIASSSGDCTIRLWDVDTGECLRILQGHRNWVWSVAFSPDGQRLVSSSSDRSVRLWEVKTGLCLGVLSGHRSQVRSVAFHPNAQVVASGGGDQTIHLWDSRSGECLRVLTDHNDWVWSVAFSPIGDYLASGSGDRTIRLWDWQTGTCLAVLEGHTSPVRSVAFSPDAQQLISAGEDHTVRIWDLATQTCIQTLPGHQNWVWSVAVNADWIASSGADETIKLWNRQTGDCLRTFQAERPYEGMKIAGVTGITESQKAILRTLGAID
jgi:WD40 repeat protein